MASTDISYVSEATFADLVDDCFRCVFENLTLKQKCGVIRVCGRWQKTLTEIIEESSSLDLEVSGDLSQSAIAFYQCKEDIDEWQRLVDLYGSQASVFDNFNFDKVEKVRFRRPESLSPEIATHYLRPGDIRWLFHRLPKLSNISFCQVRMINPGYESHEITLSPLNDVVCKMKSLSLNSQNGWWVGSVLEQDNCLEVLKFQNTNKCTMWFDFESLNLSFLKVLWLETSSLAAVTEFMLNAPNLKEVRLRRIGLKDTVTRFLCVLAVFTRLRKLDIGFEKLADRSYEERKATALLPKSKIKKDCLNAISFPNIHSFKLSAIVLTGSLFSQLLASMPNLTSLKLRNVFVQCRCRRQICQNCQQFLQQIADLEKLKTLQLNNNAIRKCDFEMWCRSLAKHLIGDKLPKLRKLKCCLADVFSEPLFEAFSSKAEKSPRESFVFIAPFEERLNKQLSKGRNLSLINCDCTSKTN